MRICHIVSDMQSGGAQTFLVSLAREQVKIGSNISIVLLDKSANTPFEKKLTSELESSGIEIVHLNRRLGKNLSIISSFKIFHAFLKKKKPEIINSHLEFSHFFVALYRLLYRPKWKLRHIVSIHCAPETWIWRTRVLNKHTATIFCSESAEKLNEKRDCLSTVILNGIPNPIIDNSAEKLLAAHKVNGNSKLVLSVGRISKQKNYSFIVNVAREFRGQNVVFLICGAPDNTYDEIKPLLSEDPIVYLGVCPPNTIFSLMEKCDCFLNASLFEGLPITVLEAFFKGTPCVLSSILPHQEIGNDMPHCYLPDAFDNQKYKDAISKALQNGISKKDILYKRLPYIEKFKIENTAKLYNEFYEEIY
jgi:glycosyltransferase involved in cell wall biosynthesis